MMTAPVHSGGGLAARLPKTRGKLIPDAPLGPVTWFRVGGPAEVLFIPADAEDLGEFLAAVPGDIPVTVIGVGSNLLVRDGGVRGVVVRLGAGFGAIDMEPNWRVRAGAAALDMAVARAALNAEVAGLEFLVGIPGTVGGGLRMNAGAYGTEFKDVLIEARALDRSGELHVLSVGDFGFGYRSSAVPELLIFVEALFQGEPGARSAIAERMNEISRTREESQPIRTRTGGSTFKNPHGSAAEGRRAWELIDAAGCRGLRRGDAQVSEQHCNFLINHGGASAADLEALGEEVRRKVETRTGVALQWEIKRLGEVR